MATSNRGKKPVVWACAPRKTAWACLQVTHRLGGAARALWSSVRDVPPQQIRRVITFGELSRSPVDEPDPWPRLTKAG
jgi:hypothetical protein